MLTTKLPLVTIIAEAVLKERLIQELRDAGAKGYTLSECEGEGVRHRRVSELMGANVRIKTLVSRPVADKLLEVLATEYFPRYAVIAYVTDVEVVRGEKYI